MYRVEVQGRGTGWRFRVEAHRFTYKYRVEALRAETHRVEVHKVDAQSGGTG